MKKISFSDSFSSAYHPVKPQANEINNFNQALKVFMDKTNPNETEEHNKNLIPTFLQAFAYQDKKYEINTVGKIDLAISKEGYVEVLIEVKRPYSKKNRVEEMVRCDDMNRKAFGELLLYYMRQVYPGKNAVINPYIKHCIITNNTEWFIIKSHVLDRIAEHTEIARAYREIDKDRTASNTSTNTFYTKVKEIIYTEKLFKHLEFVYINFEEKYSPTQLRDIYKLFTPRHLLAERGTNDSNTLNKKFYNELLHILGLAETGKTKKLIQRKPKTDLDKGSLLENTITKLETEFSITDEKELFEIALELNITWLNRLLFLKLLEAKLVFIHSDSNVFDKFLTPNIIESFDILNTLFFEVLAKELNDRASLTIKAFEAIPYLNSSLFETTELERKYLRISGLKDNLTIDVPLSSQTIMKGTTQNTLEYLLTFLNSYDFGGDASNIVKKDNETLINASVLGLIFEKINGYKDGSFFTPSFITMYMTRESIRKSVIDKFNTEFGWNCKSINCIYDKEPDIDIANRLIDSITICDPAVGSGHFLVSALNEILVIKSELKILRTKDKSKKLRTEIFVKNDELYIKDTDGNGDFFKYKQNKNGSFFNATQEIQEAIFYEKQQIIENQLFGVDINPNSVKITRLRLWIELLKHSYYENRELVTLPNIDINIKCGNSLISKFSLKDSDTKNKLFKNDLDEYKEHIKDYKKEKNKGKKQEIEQKINDIKNSFKEGLHEFSPMMIKFKKVLKEYVNNYKYEGLSEELILIAVKNNHGLQTVLFENETDIQKVKKQTKEKILQKLNKMYQTIKEFENNEMYEKSFEWRFEFPEVLNDDGDFIGFDIVIGNPPYGANLDGETKSFYKVKYENVHMRTIDTFNYFISMSSELLNENAILSFIVPNNLLYQNEYEKTRGLLINDYTLLRVINIGDDVFDDANVPTCIIEYRNFKTKSNYDFKYIDIRSSEEKEKEFESIDFEYYDKKSILKIPTYTFGINPKTVKLIEKVKNKSYLIDDIAQEVASGISTGGDKIFRVSQDFIDENKLEEDILQKVLVGREVNKYEINDTEHRLIYTTRDTVVDSYPHLLQYLESFKDKLMTRSESKKGILPWFSLGRNRYKELFTEDKILIRQTADSVIATFDNEKYFVLNSLLVFKIDPKFDIDYKFSLAILNSKLTTFIYKNYTGEEGRTFAEVKPKNIRKLYIPKVDRDIQNEFVKIVNEIIGLKKQNIDAVNLEIKIDKMVYELYGLTSEEISIVEKN